MQQCVRTGQGPKSRQAAAEAYSCTTLHFSCMLPEWHIAIGAGIRIPSHPHHLDAAACALLASPWSPVAQLQHTTHNTTLKQ